MENLWKYIGHNLELKEDNEYYNLRIKKDAEFIDSSNGNPLLASNQSNFRPFNDPDISLRLNAIVLPKK